MLGKLQNLVKCTLSVVQIGTYTIDRAQQENYAPCVILGWRVGGKLPSLPSELLNAVVEQGGARLAVVVGAGCSIEAPTAMPLARELAREAHRRLVSDGVIAANECPDPTDLAALATLVFQKTGSQYALVCRFPLDRMKTARPNAGYKILVALMVEGVVSHALTLNFDLAAQNAAVDLGKTIKFVDQPNQLIPTSKTTVFLHGSVNSSCDDLVLRWKQSMKHGRPDGSKSSLSKCYSHRWYYLLALAQPPPFFLTP